MKTITEKTYVVKRIQLPYKEQPQPAARLSLFKRIQQYINNEAAGENRFKWVGFTMAAQAIVITPLISIVLSVTSGMWMPLWFAAAASMYATFIPILSGLPAKPVMKVFFINLLVSAAILLTALVYFLTH